MKLCIEAFSNLWEIIKTIGEGAITIFSGLLDTIKNLIKGIFTSDE